MPDPTPPKLRKGDRANFSTLCQALEDQRLALVSAVRKSDNKPVALVCAVSDVPNSDDLRPMPLAVMIEGNPFEDFYDPTVTLEKETA